MGSITSLVGLPRFSTFDFILSIKVSISPNCVNTSGFAANVKVSTRLSKSNPLSVSADPKVSFMDDNCDATSNPPSLPESNSPSWSCKFMLGSSGICGMALRSCPSTSTDLLSINGARVAALVVRPPSD